MSGKLKLDVKKTCFFFFDYDGTVRIGNEIPEVNRAALLNAQALGHKLILCTGRAQGGLARDKYHLSIPWDGIICGGADLFYEGKCLRTQTVEKADALTWVGFGMRQRCRTIFEGQREIVCFDFDQHPEAFTMKERFEILRRVEEILKTNPITKFTLSCVYPQQKKLPRTQMHCVFHPTYTEVFSKGCDKGAAIKLFCELLGVPLSQCACFGDSMNDYAMFQVCPTGICMKNSPAALEEIATYCAKAEYGVAEGLEWLLSRE
ncbi:MAG: HAD family phosphatase [Clostridia bacterium]|nr:HAD family phosphatase [Clostridia bacterium]